MIPARGLLLNSRMILAFAVLLVAVILPLDFYFYRDWKEVKLESIRKNLVYQVDLLSQLAAELPDRPIKAKFTLPAIYQVFQEDLTVLWDSTEPSRIQTKIKTPHPLLAKALSEGKQKDVLEFDDTLGAYHKNSEKRIALGAVPLKSIFREQSIFVQNLVLVSLIVFFSSMLLATLLIHFAGKPLRDLVFNALPFLDGQIPELPSSSAGEADVLVQALNKVSSQIQGLHQVDIQKIQIEQEVEGMSSLQLSLLPDPHIATPRFEIESNYISAAKAGGDCWGYFETEKYLVLYIADVTGHGLSSSLITSACRGCFAALEQLYNEYPEMPALPSFILRFANNAILRSAQDELNMTMFVASYSFEEQRMLYASAGHNPAWKISPSNTGEGLMVESILSRGPRLGEGDSFEAPLDQSVPFGEDDVFFLYTDGLTNCLNDQDAALGKPRTQALLKESLASAPSLSKGLEFFMNRVTEFQQSHAIEDDISFVAFKRRKAA